MRTYYLTKYNEETKNWVRLAKEFTTFNRALAYKKANKLWAYRIDTLYTPYAGVWYK